MARKFKVLKWKSISTTLLINLDTPNPFTSNKKGGKVMNGV